MKDQYVGDVSDYRKYALLGSRLDQVQKATTAAMAMAELAASLS